MNPVSAGAAPVHYHRRMNSDTLECVLADAVAGRRLLTHPFYRRWEAGTLRLADLAEYAAQYRHVEAELPATLARCAESLPAGPVRTVVEATLRDESGSEDDTSHLELFDDYARATGAPNEAAATPATAALVALYREAAEAGPAATLAVLAAYEVQAAEIAATKGDGLRRWYAMDEDATRFWDVHAQLDDLHHQWTLDALAALAEDPAEVVVQARRAAEAWWAFLDEREALLADAA